MKFQSALSSQVCHDHVRISFTFFLSYFTYVCPQRIHSLFFWNTYNCRFTRTRAGFLVVSTSKFFLRLNYVSRATKYEILSKEHISLSLSILSHFQVFLFFLIHLYNMLLIRIFHIFLISVYITYKYIY